MKKPTRGARTRRVFRAVAGAGMRRLVRRSEDDDRLFGEALRAELDEMKGMAMKVGQILSYLDGLPPETQRVLESLQQGAAPRPIAEMRAVLEEELAAPLESLFDSFDEHAVAAASIGQVHRATYRQREVAVKIQYPNIEDSFDADLGRLRSLSKLARMGSNVDGPALVEELGARLREECDYRVEFDNQEVFRLAYSHDASVIVPEGVPERSTRRVLTTTWEYGLTFQEFCEQATQAERLHAAKTLMRFTWRSFFSSYFIHADPHPGNFLFRGHAVVVLDFGCVRHFEPTFVDAYRIVYRCVLEGRREDFSSALEATGMVVSKRHDFDMHWKQLLYELEPYRTPDFRFTREYESRAVEFSRPSNKNLRRMAIPRPSIWLMRVQYGLHSMLQRLDARGDFRDTIRAALDA